MVDLLIRDDGVGGAEHGRGSGLIGLKDRVEILGGTLTLTSPTQAGTTRSPRSPWRSSDRRNSRGRAHHYVTNISTDMPHTMPQASASSTL